ncbi:hypothetical protein JB92DRAFT_3142013 [Gautieria morchelliformis]|nr:hypothetical protein JB92DRAFT_3142013 [Gautieria morchelliformis]
MASNEVKGIGNVVDASRQPLRWNVGSGLLVTCPREERITSRQKHRREGARDTQLYELRPRTSTRSATHKENPNSTSALHMKGRLSDWQTKVLQNIVKAAIWNPGDETIKLLIIEFKNRTEKQLKDWFRRTRQRHLVRKKGAGPSRGYNDSAKTKALEGLISLRRRNASAKHELGHRK